MKVYINTASHPVIYKGKLSLSYFVSQLSDKDMSLLEERIKRAAKNRPVIKKPPPEPEVPTVRGGSSAAAGRPNRVTPKLAQPAPQLLRERGPAKAAEQQPSALKR